MSCCNRGQNTVFAGQVPTRVRLGQPEQGVSKPATYLGSNTIEGIFELKLVDENWHLGLEEFVQATRVVEM